MKKILLTLLISVAAWISYAQAPNHLRVLNFVPDDCHSVQLFNLDTMARTCELKAIQDDNLLSFISKEDKTTYKLLKTLLKSWVDKDDKLGIDFTASVATVGNRIFLIPLNNEKNFEKNIQKLIGSKAHFKTVNDGGAGTIRKVESEELDVFCTPSVACIMLDMAELEQLFPTPQNGADLWQKMQNSHFLQTKPGQMILSGEISGYTVYNESNPMVQILGHYATAFAQISPDMLKDLNVEIYSRGQVTRDRMTSVSEIRNLSTKTPDFSWSEARREPQVVEQLLPYFGDNTFAMMVSTMSGLSKMGEFPPAFSEYKSLLPLMDKPFVAAIIPDGMYYMIATMIDDPEQLPTMLNNYVEAHNRHIDSLYQAQSEAPAPTIGLESLDDDNDVEVSFDEMMSTLQQTPVDPAVNKKSVIYQPEGDLKIYYLLTTKSQMNYDTYERELGMDTAYLVVKGNKLFFAPKKQVVEMVNHPTVKAQPVSPDFLQHAIYMRMDVQTLMNGIAGGSQLNITLPFDNMTMFVDDNFFTTNIEAVKGLQHGIFYEMVKSFKELSERFDKPIYNKRVKVF